MQMLVLDGVIPITYRGVPYQIPVMIWCRPLYPNDAPVPYVRPTPTMMLREGHSSVNKEGRVYLQHYLSIWDPAQFSLYGLVVAMIRVFSAEPPVNSKPPTPSTPNDGAERQRLLSALTKRLSDRLLEVNNEAVTEIAQILKRGDAIRSSKQHMSKEAHDLLERYTKVNNEVEQLQHRHDELKKWSDAVGDSVNEDDVNFILQYQDMMIHQIAQCVAEDHAYTDTLDQVDEAFVKGVIDHDTYVKEIRNLSREQFFPRALRKKLEKERVRLHRAKNGTSMSRQNSSQNSISPNVSSSYPTPA